MDDTLLCQPLRRWLPVFRPHAISSRKNTVCSFPGGCACTKCDHGNDSVVALYNQGHHVLLNGVLTHRRLSAKHNVPLSSLGHWHFQANLYQLQKSPGACSTHEGPNSVLSHCYFLQYSPRPHLFCSVTACLCRLLYSLNSCIYINRADVIHLSLSI